jgi:hypothetical protein
MSLIAINLTTVGNRELVLTQTVVSTDSNYCSSDSADMAGAVRTVVPMLCNEQISSEEKSINWKTAYSSFMEAHFLYIRIKELRLICNFGGERSLDDELAV